MKWNWTEITTEDINKGCKKTEKGKKSIEIENAFLSKSKLISELIKEPFSLIVTQWKIHMALVAEADVWKTHTTLLNTRKRSG